LILIDNNRETSEQRFLSNKGEFGIDETIRFEHHLARLNQEIQKIKTHYKINKVTFENEKMFFRIVRIRCPLWY
jgi:hypothetical protein